MNAAELMQNIIISGADEDGIRDRFGSNADLYEMCFQEFLQEANFALLSSAMAERDYRQAFDAAHALKGLSGNLGLSGFYDADCALVEALRAQSYDQADTLYAEVDRQHKRLLHLFSEQPEAAPLPQPDPAAAAPPDRRQDKDKQRDSRLIIISILVICAALLLAGLLFGRIGVIFRHNIVKESSQHLTEMSNQIRLYVEEQVANDWRVARSVADSILDSNYIDDDQSIFHMLQRKREVWEVSDLMLYTENGYCVYTSGNAENNDIASDAIVMAREKGRQLSVIDSHLIYTVPVDTQLRYNGSPIAAVSVVQDMSTFLDDMHFSSFDEEAWMYLTEEDGVIVSMLSNDAATSAFNFRAVIQDMSITPLSGSNAATDYLSAPDTAAFLLSDGDNDTYMVSSPIATGSEPLRLFYLAPEAVVNRTMNGFSQQMTAYSMVIIALFVLLALLAFLFMYRSRKRLLDKALLTREHMFDLLIKNTRTAFALFTTDQPEPTYISSNVNSVIGAPYWAIYKDAEGYHMRGSSGEDSDSVRQANEMLRGWDGQDVFKSGYIRNDMAATPYYFDFQLYPVDDQDADFVGIAQDVTQTYAREEATRQAMEMANQANEAKSRFLSNMSHDIRTPMNAIMNMTNFALESIDQPKKIGPYLHTIRESSEHLLQLINDVLDMSRIESGQTQVYSAPFDLLSELQKQLDMAGVLCQARRQTLLADLSGLHTTDVRGDALKFSQIIMNLLSNAIKFTPDKGAIRFIAREIPSLREDIVDMRFTVEDNGIGISEADMAHIFEPFCRADDNRVSKTEGTGLGLSICKSYVEAMGGSIHCESEKGEGSTFTVELFFQKADERESDNAAPDQAVQFTFLGLHCLVAEDNATNQIIAKSLLERLGFIVDFADDGGECLERFLSSRPGAYDVIYMDIRMPVLDGCQTAEKIRASSHPQAASIPIIAMTANVFAEDIEKARLAGMDAFLGKPIVSFDLIEQTNKALKKKKGW